MPDETVGPAPPCASLRGAGPAENSWRAELVVVALLGLLLALPLRGLYLKPHGDFFGIWETGESLLDGQLPVSFKRAPLYPVLVAGLGRIFSAASIVEAPAQHAAEWINALLLPLNVALVFLLGRRWAGGMGRWAAWWFALLPVGFYCTAHVLVEPLLITMTLCTLIAAQRNSSWAWVAAAAAVMTRYDVAGLIPGLMLADVLARRPWRGTLVRGALAALPLTLWLILTAATWRTGAEGHYLTELAERPQFDLSWALAITSRVSCDLDHLPLPYLLSDLDAVARQGLQFVLVVLALAGVIFGLRGHARAMLTALATFTGYTIVHALFPFEFDRFGYPLAPVYLLAAALGAHELAAWVRIPAALRRPGNVALLVLAAILLATLVEQARLFVFLTSARYAGVAPLPALVLLATAAIWGLTGTMSSAGWRRLVALLALAVVGLTQLHTATARVSAGGEMDNLVLAARWVRDELPAGARVLSATPGLLRLYAGRTPADRFLRFEDIAAETWPEILAECRRREIDYILWYDQVFSELGDYYVRRCRLERYARLSNPAEVDGVAVVQQYADRPNLWILRVSPGSAPHD